MSSTQKPTIRVKRLKPLQQQSKVTKVDSEIWSIECTVDELQLNLCKIKEQITIDPGFYVDGQKQTRTVSVAKYYRQALELMKWIPILRPPPEFVIYAKDLSPRVKEELEGWIDKPSTLAYILKQAVGRIFENLDFSYYHISIARNLKVGLEP
jgi:hypothetical protein